MSDIYYSTNNEEFNFDNDHDAICDILEDETISEGSIVTLYRGKGTPRKGSDYLRYIPDDLIDDAFDESGEFSESWANELSSKSVDIQKCIKSALDDFLTKNNMQPDFLLIQNSTEVKYRIDNIGEYGFEYTEIEVGS